MKSGKVSSPNYKKMNFQSKKMGKVGSKKKQQFLSFMLLLMRVPEVLRSVNLPISQSFFPPPG